MNGGLHLVVCDDLKEDAPHSLRHLRLGYHLVASFGQVLRCGLTGVGTEVSKLHVIPSLLSLLLAPDLSSQLVSPPASRGRDVLSRQQKS